MPRFHAGFSIGSVGGAAIAAACSHVGSRPPRAAAATCVVVVVVIGSPPRLPPVVEPTRTRSAHVAAARLAEPRTLAIGLVVLSFALCEGIANDWLALGLVDGYDVPHAAGSAGFAVFVTAMTVGRLVGGSLTTRFGRVATLRATAVLVIIGSSPWSSPRSWPVRTPVRCVWGLGASLGFPMGMTAAGDDPRKAAARLSVVSSIGYAAFLGGPPLVGTLADHVGIHESLLVAVGAAVRGHARLRRGARAEQPGVLAASDRWTGATTLTALLSASWPWTKRRPCPSPASPSAPPPGRTPSSG